jgi:hypothetical protein
LRDWRQGLYIFFGWLFIEDFVRKYLGNNMVVYFAKDFLVILVYISFYSERRNRKQKVAFRPPFLLPLLIFLWFAAAQVFNPASSSLFYGALGLKLYFLYVPLMYLGYALVDSELDLRKFFMFNALLVFVVAIVGLIALGFHRDKKEHASLTDGILARVDNLPILDPRPADEILGYDENGLPR